LTDAHAIVLKAFSMCRYSSTAAMADLPHSSLFHLVMPSTSISTSTNILSFHLYCDGTDQSRYWKG